MMKVGLCTIAFRELRLKDVLRMAEEIGFDGVEIWGKEPHMPNRYDGAYVAEMRDLAASLGLEVNSFGSYLSPLTPGFEELKDDTIKIAAGLKARMMRIWGPYGKPGSLVPEEYARAVRQIGDLCKCARDQDLTVAFEFHDNCITETSTAMLKMIEDVGAPNLKTYWQPSFREDAEDFCGSLTRLLPHLVNVHAQNFAASYKERTLLSEGRVDYRRVVSILGEAGYDGYLELEFVGQEGHPVEWARKDYEFLRKLTQEESL